MPFDGVPLTRSGRLRVSLTRASPSPDPKAGSGLIEKTRPRPTYGFRPAVWARSPAPGPPAADLE